MKIDLTELLICFDELMSDTDEEQKVYWLKFNRIDDISIILIISVYESHTHIIIENDKVTFSTISLNNCEEVRVLDQEKKCLEVLNDKGRFFVSLVSDSILVYES